MAFINAGPSASENTEDEYPENAPAVIFLISRRILIPYLNDWLRLQKKKKKMEISEDKND